MNPASKGPGFNQKKPQLVKMIHPTGAKGAKEVEMATTLVADDAPPVSAMSEPLTLPPGEEQTHSMEVNDRDDHQPPASLVSYRMSS